MDRVAAIHCATLNTLLQLRSCCRGLHLLTRACLQHDANDAARFNHVASIGCASACSRASAVHASIDCSNSLAGAYRNAVSAG